MILLLLTMLLSSQQSTSKIEGCHKAHVHVLYDIYSDDEQLLPCRTDVTSRPDV